MIKRKKKQKRISMMMTVILCVFLLAEAAAAAAISLESSNEFVNMAVAPMSGIDLIREVFGGMTDQRMCPGVGLTSATDDDEPTSGRNCQDNEEDPATVKNPHKIVGCRELRLGGGSKNLTFSCDCKYMRSNRNNCDIRRKAPEYEPLHDSCLFVYVGMAVKGYNQMYNIWTDKESCFNLCLRTTIRNGALFDCRSFEHWHRDCPEATTASTATTTSTSSPISTSSSSSIWSTSTLRFGFDLFGSNSSAEAGLGGNNLVGVIPPPPPPPSSQTFGTTLMPSKTCASFTLNDHDQDDDVGSSDSESDASKPRGRNEKMTSKLGYCVLSNQTMKSAGRLFAPNNKVTYYEILCKRPNEPLSPSHPYRTFRPSQSIQTQRTKPTQAPTTKDNVKPSPASRTTKSPGIVSRPPKTSPSSSSPSYYRHDDWPAFSTTTSAAAGSRCTFNPCSNGGICLLIDRDRFTCTCSEFYHGVYCDYKIIEKKCQKTYMELIIHHDLANQFQIQMSDLYINNKTEAIENSNCRIKALNRTSSRFRIPYNKCSTFKKETGYEIVYTNQLFSLREPKPISGKSWPSSNGGKFSPSGENYRTFLDSFECRFDKQINPNSLNTTEIIIPSDPSSSPTFNSLSNSNNNDKVVKSTNPCILDLLNLKLNVFIDSFYKQELNSPYTNRLDMSMSSRPLVSYDHKLYVQFFVQYSALYTDHFNKLQDKLKFIHLTLRRCYLTRTQNENTQILQVLIDNGCERKGVKFDPSNSKSSIQFSFAFSLKIKSEKPPIAYLHCFPEICTDIQPPKSSSNKEDHQFFSQFKLCEHLSRNCQSNSASSTASKIITTTTTTVQSDPPKNYYNEDVVYEENSDPGTTLYSTNDYGNSFNNPPPPPPPLKQPTQFDYNRRPFMPPNKFRPSNRGRYHSSSGDYSLDENDFSRFEPHRVEEERIFLLKSWSPGSSSGCNNRFSYGPIYLEEKSDYDLKENEQNKPIEERFVENLANRISDIKLGHLFLVILSSYSFFNYLLLL